MSSSRKYFVDIHKQNLSISEHLAKDSTIRKAGFAKVEILKTPMGHRVVIHALRLGLIIGKAGRNIKRLTEELETLYGLESPSLEVKELENPDLVARIQGDKLMSQIERGFHFRRASHAIIRRIMASGARGVEILISGKLSSQRARSEAFREGFVAKAGKPAQDFVDEAVVHCLLKQGIIGIRIRIMQPTAILPDEPLFYDRPFGDEDTSLDASMLARGKHHPPPKVDELDTVGQPASASGSSDEGEDELRSMETAATSTAASDNAQSQPPAAATFEGDYDEEEDSKDEKEDKRKESE